MSHLEGPIEQAPVGQAPEPQSADAAANAAAVATEREWQAAVDPGAGQAAPADWLAAAALGFALFGISIGSLFFVMAGREMSPNAIALNRLAIAAIAFAGLNGLHALRQPSFGTTPPATNPPKWSDGLLLLTVWLQGESLLPPSGTSAIAVVGLALLTQMGGHGLITYSLKRFSAGVVSLVLLSVPIISAVMALVALQVRKS